MPTPFSRLLRRSAALLAWVALLAIPVQGVLACPMPSDVAAVDVNAGEHAEHAEHLQQAEQPAPPSHHLPGTPDAPCEDLAHCAVAAIPMATRALESVQPPTLRALSAPHDAPSAPARAVEPPPPKA